MDLEMYGLSKEFKIQENEWGDFWCYSVVYATKNPDIKFAEVGNFYIDNTNVNGITVAKFNKEYLISKNIEFLIEDNQIIPIGLIDCYNTDKDANKSKFTVFVNKDRNLYKASQILKNIERAIEIKVQAIDFVNNFSL